MARKRNQGKTDTVEQTEQADTVEQTDADTVEQTEQIDTVEQTEQAEQIEQIEQKPNKQKPSKGNTKTVTEKEVSKIPEFVKVRVTQGYNLFHPYSNKCVTTELQEFPCDNWILAQLRAGYVELYTVTNKSLLWEDGKLVYAE